MVYYGVVSKGCQRCRQRKIKACCIIGRLQSNPRQGHSVNLGSSDQCDERKPGCMRCEKSRTQCTGYRDLNGVLFRDESDRIIRKTRQLQQSEPISTHESLATSTRPPTSSATTSESLPLTSSFLPTRISYPLSQPVNELGATFFFAKYMFNAGPVFTDYHDWLTQAYLEGGPNDVLRAAIEAVGLAGISNIRHAPHVAFESKQQYCVALTAMKRALDDPAQAVADTTLMAVILLGFFETVNFENWDRDRRLTAHIRGATTLLELRGQGQFTKERGGLLFVQVRSQILWGCMQQHIAVPPALVRTTYNFTTSGIRQQWQHRNVASPGSMCLISFRIVNLWAAFKTGKATDLQAIRESALEIDADLEAWRAGASPSWRYATADALEVAAGACFNGKRHVYPNFWIAEAWNNWRKLRILVNQIIVQTEVRSSAPESAQKCMAISVIQQMSIDLCISVYSFSSTPRILSLIQPMYLVSLEELNIRSVRCFAVEQLRQIDASMGIRQARLLADTVSKSLCEPLKDSGSVAGRLANPLIPSC